ncbi:hypothetical protein BATDEDRAFT_28349 [Batrachochytrium dendrobatidis JAM81]|uniref:Uncharacterized protein n=1 Tax=Batrachochytrium dendrobatidis (strain JAM81 / FGSC 10211) TaxID=684364 RepID=F4PDR2_BATDJ|nr:uncharacterized protein BATDEDRAFT_28349 [Batrachochytrium dendrobatidis JAM81]EGF76439.1 hypothetical protein BATDEDRAFT_28349 [Batrachochytrium dendrobatidis JAM81]|eukprot:XP_006682781.1 hypothetical protein BATDEDRAFT_28349 [Batrachochytrium dendrobatidis JAM81]
MPKRFLNVEYNTISTEIDVTGISRLGKLKSAIKSEYGSAMADIGAPQLQLYTDSNKDQLINTWAAFNSLAADYFAENGSCVVIGVSPPSSRQPTQTDLFEAGYTSLSTANHQYFFRKKQRTETSVLFSPCQILFYNNVCKATENDGWILFGQDIPSTSLNKLYIRDSYKSIASRINPGIKRAIITGTPGIGKSLFLIYLLWKLVKEGKRVLFIYHPSTIYYDGQGGVFYPNFLPSNNNVNFWASDLWCLFDAKGKNAADLSALPYEDCSFVLSTSPRREMVNDFKKFPHLRIFYMPIWTEIELETITPCFVTVIDWRDRFKILGGIPRYVLEDTSGDPTKLLQAACRQCDLDDCIKIIGLNSTITDKSQVVHSLVHMTSVDPFTESSVAFASQTALDIIVQIKGTEAKRKMAELLASCEGNPLTAALCGYIFEPTEMFDSHKLVHGNEKSKPEETTLTIPSSVKLVVDRVLLGQTQDQLYVPKTKNYAAIDAWIPGIGAFQMTVGKRHDIKSGVEEDLKMLGKGAEKLYWLLPPLYYHSFTKKTPQDIDQYAVKIPYPTVEN